MDNKVFSGSGLPIRRSVELLPNIFQTPANKKFFEAIVDPLIQPGSLEKLSGYVGRKYGKTYNPTEVYIDDQHTLRSKYQLEPGVVIKQDSKVTNFYDYIDFKNQLRFFDNLIERDDRITSDEHYAWAPPIDWDKFVNYREYYWLPDGPLPVSVSGEHSSTVQTVFKVRSNGEFEWIWSPDNLKRNPDIKLYRGQTYYFEVNSPGDLFCIRTTALGGATDNYNDGVSNNGTSNGVVTFTVPFNAPDVLYYQSDSESNRYGTFRIYDITATASIDVEADIIGAKEFTSSNGIVFTNGLKVNFTGTVTPAIYAEGYWYVEGVGSGIRLVSIQDLELPIISTTNPEVLFDANAFDTVPYDDATSYPTQKDYITINRASVDNNSWSRYNRWFHRSVIDYSNTINNQSSTFSEDARAKRPVIEFQKDLQLFNHGAIAKQSVDLVDTYTTDVFSTIEGQADGNIDGVELFEGARVLFTNDTDPTVNGKIYKVTFITTQSSPIFSSNTSVINIDGKEVPVVTGISRQISLIETDDTNPQIGEGVYVKRGNTQKGNMFHYNGTSWIVSQRKNDVQQAPLFDCFDSDSISYADTSVYPLSTFTGSKLISYIVSSSSVTDTELGFGLSYLNIDNVGDIQFNFDFDNDSFTWQQSVKDTITQEINAGFYRFNTSLTDYTFKNGWEQIDNTYIQPVIDSITVATAKTDFPLTTCMWKEATREKYIVYVNGKLKKTGWSIVTNPINNKVRTLRFTTALAVNDTITLKVFTDATPDQGYYELPMGLEKNPLNLDLSTFTLGQITDHLGTIFEIDDRITGTFPGNSTLRDIDSIEMFGRRFVKHSGLMPVATTLLCDKDLNIIKAIRNAKAEYTKFKNNLMQLSVELPYSLDPVQMLDEVVEALSVGKNEYSAFFNSDMIGTGATNTITYTVEDTGITVFALTNKFDLVTQSDVAVYVYINGEQLLHNVDYTFDSTFGFVRISKALAEGDVIEIKEFVSTAFNYIPPTPTKLGLYKKFVPEIYVDTTYKTPQTVIRGHDGSITMSYGDFRDDILLEFEKRVYNNLKLEYDESIFHIDQTFGSYFVNGLYSKAEFDATIREDYLSWISDTDVDYVNNTYFDEFDSFTYTYSTSTDQAVTLALPGWWRGVYNFYYDTDAPHLRPWEMQGFTIKPTWWESEYGAAPYTAGNLLLWEDIRDGIIRQGDKQNLKGEARYARPTILSHLPVDDAGNLLSPLDSGLAAGFSLVRSKGPFVFGDWSPAETAWRKSSEYPFATMIALSLLTPCDFITKSFNRLDVKRNNIGQLVSSHTNKLLTIDDFALTLSGTSSAFGTINYVAALLISQTKSTSVIVDKLSNIEVKLSNRLSGFVDKDQFSYILDSRTPQSASSSIYVPPENFEVFFNASSPVQSVVYSGVVIEKQAAGWKLSGYNKLNPTFKYFEALPTNADYLISVGGVSDNFVVWTANKFYGKGIIVSYGDAYYRAKTNHTSTEDFVADNWQVITKLPMVGAVEAFSRRQFDDTVMEIPYGTMKSTIQEVVDFLQGYGAYLENQGFVFDQYDTDLQVSRDWTTSVKEFLYWTSHNWNVGSIVTLSPAASQLKVNLPLGTVDNLLDSFYDYSILKSDGTRLPINYISVDRDYQQYSLSTLDTPDGIYFARLNFVLKEHVAIFDKRTVFNDVIYDPAPGYRQERIKIVGFRTIEWDGDYTSPGFLFDDAAIVTWEPYTDYKLGDIVRYKDFYYTSQRFQQGTLSFNHDNWSKTDQLPKQGLITNYDYRINQFDDYYDLDAAGVQTSQRDLARHAIGYQPRQYLQNIAQDEISQYKLYQGFIREKGTANAITKIFDKLTRTNLAGIVLNEEWAFRVGNLGGVDQINEYEFKLAKADFRLNPQPVLLINGKAGSDYVDNYIRLNDTHFTNYPGSFTNEIMPVADYEATTRSAGYVKSSDVDFVVKSRSDILNLNIADFKDNTTVWVTFDDAPVFWTVLRYKLSNIIIDSVEKSTDGTLVTINTQQYHTFNADDIIGIQNVNNLTGFFKVDSVTAATIVVKYSGTNQVEIADSAFVPIGRFEDARFATTKDLDQTAFAKLPTNSKLWIDNNGDGGWEVLNRTKQYSTSKLDGYDLRADSALGTATVYTDSLDKIVSSMPGANTVGIFVDGTDELTPTQLLSIPVGFETAFDKQFGKTLSISPDGRWIVVGIPAASAVPSFYRGVYNNSTISYETGSVVRSNGKLWRALTDLYTDASTLSIENSKVEPVTLNVANDVGFPSLYTNQGAIAIYENTENFGNYQGVWNTTTTYSENDVVSLDGYFYKLVETVPSARVVTSTNENPSDPRSTITVQPSGKVWQVVGGVNKWYLSKVVISPNPQSSEYFGSQISVNGSGSNYWMTVTASGTGIVYLYRYENGEWKQLEDHRYKGLYVTHPFSTFEPDDVVFFDNNFYQATQFVPSGTSPTNATYWKVLPSYSDLGSLPTNAALADSVNDTNPDALSGKSIINLTAVSTSKEISAVIYNNVLTVDTSASMVSGQQITFTNLPADITTANATEVVDSKACISYGGTGVNAANTFTGLSQKSTSGSGINAVFTVIKNIGTSYSETVRVIITSPGTGYELGDVVVINGSSLGGTAITNDLSFTISKASNILLDDTVSNLGVVSGQRIYFTGTVFSNIQLDTPYYISSATGSTIQLSNTPGGDSLVFNEDTGSMGTEINTAGGLTPATTYRINQVLSSTAITLTSESTSSSVVITNSITGMTAAARYGVSVTSDLTEEVKPGDAFGYTTDLTASGGYLAVGAPRSNSQYFETYRGFWNYYQGYVLDDVVRFGNAYYRLNNATSGPLTSDPFINDLVPQFLDRTTGWSLVDDVSYTSSGKVFIYTRDSNNVYACSQVISSETLPAIVESNENTDTLTVSDLINNNDGFGSQVRFTPDGSKLFISSPNADVNGQDKGRVFVFENMFGTFKLVQAIFSPSDVYNEKFGSTMSVSKTGNTLVVGAINGRTKNATTYDNLTTTYDLGTTTFFTTIGTTGTVWSYDFIDTQYVLGEELRVDDISQGEGFGTSLAASDTTVAVGSPFFKNTSKSSAIIGRLFKFVRKANATSWFPYETQQPLVALELLSSLFLYNPVTKQKINDIDIIDPFKMKIVGIADQEIKYKTPYDPAIYSIGTDANQVDTGIAWLDQHVGEVWWDVGTAKWPWYEQGNDAYRIGNWGKLAHGSSIDVYEWVESIYSPSTWAALSGTADGLSEGISGTPYIADDTTLSYKQTVDPITGLVSKTTYYYWVKNKLAAPSTVASRQLSAYEIATLIESPELSGIPLIGLTSSQSLICYNVQPIISADTCIVNLQFDKQSRGKNLEHREYQLLTEGVADSLPSAQLERKWIDSLIGFDTQGNIVPDPNLPDLKKYGIAFRPRQSMFVDRQTALTVVINNINSVLTTQPFADLISFNNLNLIDDIPDVKTRLYDVIVETEIDLTAIGTAKVHPAVLKANIVNGSILSVTIVDPGFGYKYPPKIEIRGSGIGATVEVDPALLDATTGKLINPKGEITSVIVTNRGKKYTYASAVPRSFAALVATPSVANSPWSIFTYDNTLGKFYKSRSQAFNTTDYWSRIDWWLDGYSPNTRTHAIIPALYAESEIVLTEGQLVKVTEYGSGGWAVLERVSTGAEILGKYRLVGKHEGTIQIDVNIADAVQNKSGYDAGTTYYDNVSYDRQPVVELRNILTAVKNDIYNNDLSVEWNKLFFTSIHYILSEQLYVDWVFKTSFLNAIHNVGNLAEKPTYQNDNLDSYRDYVDEVKPYRSKVREFTSRYLSLDKTQTFTGDFDLPAVYNADTNSIETVTATSDLLTQYPWKAWADHNTYVVTDLKITNGGGGYITPPVVNITGGGGIGAKGRAYIRAGKVTVIELLAPGSGYTSAPTVTLVGGNGNGSAGIATVAAIIGGGLVRSVSVGVKFDRYSKTGRFENTVVEETITGTGSRTVFELKYPPSSDRDEVLVMSGSNQLMRSDYSPVAYGATVNGVSVLKGKILFTTAPAANEVITITYSKNIDTLDAVNRIENHYSPVAGMLGNDKAQLMTGIDFGGVIVQGTTFDVSGGWDALPWFTEGWDTTIPVFSDFYYVMPAKPAPISISAAEGNTIRAKLTFTTAQTTVPFVIGSYITVAGMDNAGYNGTYIVTEATTTYVSYFNTTVNNSTGGTVVALTGVEQLVAPTNGQLITVYKKSKRVTPVDYRYTGNGTRTDFDLIPTVDTPIVLVDDVEQSLWDATRIPPAGDYFIADNKVRFLTAPATGSVVSIETYDAPVRLDGTGGSMTTYVGDGIETKIYIPDSVEYAANDIFIFRPAESDGSLAIIDRNLLDANVSGGAFSPYNTANGSTPDEIVIEGDSFISPDQVPAPEENIPGQVLESVSIKVFHTDATGAPEMITKVYTTDGTRDSFAIGQRILEIGNVFVLLDKETLKVGTDYQIDFASNTINFATAPATDKTLEVKSIGISGAGILDYQEFVADGVTRFFLTKAPYALTNNVIVTIDGVEVPASFSNSNGRVNKADNAFIELGSAPTLDSIVQIVVVSTPTSLTRIQSQEIALTSAYTYALTNFVADAGPIRSNVIVDIDGVALTPPDATFAIYDGTNNVLTVGIDPAFSENAIAIEDISVYVNNQPLDYVTHWSYNPTARAVTIRSGNVAIGDSMLVEIANTGKYTLVDDTIVLANSVAFTSGQKLTVTWFKNYEHLQLIRDVFTGGKYSFQLQTVPKGVSYIWVYLNGVALIQDIEFELDNLRSVVHLRNDTTPTDVVQIITYGVTTRSEPLTFEIFKDMLNRHQFKRGAITELKLARDLTYYADEIQVNDASALPARGIIVINSERIEYQTKNGNILGQLRRGIFGTAIAELHSIFSIVVDVSDSETLPYAETQTKDDFYGNGSTKLFGPLPFTPTKSVVSNWYRENDTFAITSNKFKIGNTYTINTVGTTDFTLLGASSNTSGVTFTALLNRNTVGTFVIGTRYAIVSLGTTTQNQWNTIAGTVGETYIVGSEFTCDTPGLDSLGTAFGNGTAQATSTGSGNGTVLEYTSIPTNFYQSNDIEVFVAGRRLIKSPVALFDETLGQLSPASDITVEAEFSVDGTTPYVRLTTAPAPGARVTVIQRRGNVWYDVGNNIPTSLTHENTAVAKFIQERTSLLPNVISPVGNVLNTESGDTIDDENGNPVEF